MTENTHSFGRPVVVLRFVSFQLEWNKAHYRALPSHLPKWPRGVDLRNGGVSNGHLWLRHDLLNETAPSTTDILLLQDRDSATWLNLAQRPHYLSFFFNLHYKDAEVWVELRDDYYPKFGSKARDRFDVVPLLPGQSVALHINARYWHTLAGRGTDTHYVENYCYLQHLGVFDTARLVEHPTEHLVFQPDKTVDLRQKLF